MMKYVMPLLVVVTLCAGLIGAAPAEAAVGKICVYNDAQGTTCGYTPVGGLASLYVLQVGATDVSGSRFRVDYSGVLDTYIAETLGPGFLGIGTAGNGIQISYAGCLSTSPLLLVTLQFFDQGLTPPGTPIVVEADPNAPSGFIEVVDCNSNVLPGVGGTSYWGGSLPCVDCDAIQQPPTLYVSPLNLAFPEGTTAQSFTVSNLGDPGLTWTATPSQAWINVTPSSGTDGALLSATVDRAGLSAGNYAETIDITSNGGNETVMLSVEVQPILSVTPLTLNYGSLASSLNLGIANTGSGTLNWNIISDDPWLSATPAGGSGNTAVSVDIDRTGLADGTYNSTLHLTSNGGNEDVEVSMQVLTGPILAVQPTYLPVNASAPDNYFNITNAGLPTLQWTVTPVEPWLQITSAASGSGPATVYFHADANTVPSPLPQNGTINVTSNGGNQAVSVNFTEVPSGSRRGDIIGVYTNQQATNCDYTPSPGAVYLYVVHTSWGPPEASASQFLIDISEIADLYITETPGPGILAIGKSTTGVALSYSGCRSLPQLLLTLTFLDQLLTPQCAVIRVLPDPAAPSGTIEVVDCNATKYIGIGQELHWNNPNFQCSSCFSDIKVESKTWGAVKALYKE